MNAHKCSRSHSCAKSSNHKHELKCTRIIDIHDHYLQLKYDPSI